jgi:S-adenosylmethionine hydrolase
MSTIALLTDFGTHDHYVGAMKGVINQINPKATVIDVTHEIAAHDLYHASFVLRQVVPYFAPGTIFVAVVDPTVGSSRQILAARYNDRIVLAPDNGLLTLLHRDGELQELRTVENRQFFASSLSATFHGRDVFAPVAAHISRGVALDHLGPISDHIEVLELAQPAFGTNGTITGEIVVVDRFGNLISNISAMDLSAARSRRREWHVTLGGTEIGSIQTTYSDVAPGEPVALIGSTQMLEIAVNSFSAADKLAAGRGTRVIVH